MGEDGDIVDADGPPDRHHEAVRPKQCNHLHQDEIDRQSLNKEEKEVSNTKDELGT